MFNTYAQFLRDYGMRGLNPSIEYIWMLVIVWLFIIAVKKVVRFPNKASLKLFKISIFVVMLFTMGYILKEKDNIALLVKPIKDEKQFVSVLNKILEKEYKPECVGKNYYITYAEEKVNIPGGRKQIINNYFYKIDKVTTKNVKDTIKWFETTNYASLGNYVTALRESEYTDYRDKIIEENKKVEAKKKEEAKNKVKANKNVKDTKDTKEESYDVVKGVKIFELKLDDAKSAEVTEPSKDIDTTNDTKENTKEDNSGANSESVTEDGVRGKDEDANIKEDADNVEEDKSNTEKSGDN